MVLVSYILTNYISILQTKFSNREGHEARRVGLETIPLDQHIEGGHDERQARLKIRPAPMHHLLEMTLRHEVARLIVWHAVVTRMGVEGSALLPLSSRFHSSSPPHRTSTFQRI